MHLIQDAKLDVPICKRVTQGNKNPQYPNLKAKAGDQVELRWMENGHVTKDPLDPNLNKIAGANNGRIYIYGSDAVDANNNPKLSEVRKWTRNGSKEGVLLADVPFDDGVCAEKNDSPISAERFGKGGGGDCKTTIKIPENLDPNKKFYSVLWAWDFTAKGGANAPTQWYTSCLDIEIVGTASGAASSPSTPKSNSPPSSPPQSNSPPSSPPQSFSAPSTAEQIQPPQKQASSALRSGSALPNNKVRRQLVRSAKFRFLL